MKKKLFIIGILIAATISIINITSSETNSKIQFLLRGVETLASIDLDEVTITCSKPSSGGGKCKLLTSVRCIDGSTAWECKFTGSPNNSCSETMATICTIIGHL